MKIANRILFFGTVLTLVAYAVIQARTLSAPWFPADDAQELAFVRMLSVGQFFGVDAFGLFRPVKNLVFGLFSVLEPLGLSAVRTVAILLGLMTFFLVRQFFRCVFPNERLALLGAAMWLLAPTLVSSVAWLSCVNIQLMCGFAAAAFVAHDRGRALVASLLLLLACVSYECAVAVGPCLVVFDFFLRGERIRNRAAWMRYALYAGVTLAFLAVRNLMGSVHTVNGSFANCTRLDIIFASAYLSCQHFLTWLWPFGRMAVFGGYAANSVPTFQLVLAWLVLIGIAVGALLLRRRKPVVAFGLALTLVGFLPVSNLTGVGNGPYGDYYLGIASFGLATVAAALCSVPRLRIAVLAWRALAVLVAFHWAWLWADGDRAYFASIENFPSFFGNKIVLVKRLADVGLWKEALALGAEVEQQVGSASGQMAEVNLVRGLHALRVEKNAEQALAFFEKSRMSNDVRKKFNRDFYFGCVYEDLLNDVRRADELYASALKGKWTSDSVQAADRRARLLALGGDVKAAISLWERALAIDPRNSSVRHNLTQARKMQK